MKQKLTSGEILKRIEEWRENEAKGATWAERLPDGTDKVDKDQLNYDFEVVVYVDFSKMMEVEFCKCSNVFKKFRKSKMHRLDEKRLTLDNVWAGRYYIVKKRFYELMMHCRQYENIEK